MTARTFKYAKIDVPAVADDGSLHSPHSIDVIDKNTGSYPVWPNGERIGFVEVDAEKGVGVALGVQGDQRFTVTGNFELRSAVAG